MGEFMIERMSENDALVTQYMADDAFQAHCSPGSHERSSTR
jgi:hypothetical protein